MEDASTAATSVGSSCSSRVIQVLERSEFRGEGPRCHGPRILSGRHRAAALLRRPKELRSFQARNPLLQNRLAAWLHFGEDNSHPVLRPGVNHLAVGGEGSAAARNPQLFGAHIADFSAGCERIAGSAMEFKMNGEATSLLGILRRADCSYKVNHVSSSAAAGLRSGQEIKLARPTSPPLPNLERESHRRRSEGPGGANSLFSGDSHQLSQSRRCHASGNIGWEFFHYLLGETELFDELHSAFGFGGFGFGESAVRCDASWLLSDAFRPFCHPGPIKNVAHRG